VIADGMIGNVLQWYDFAIHGYFPFIGASSGTVAAYA
jgi:hypothetical protein